MGHLFAPPNPGAGVVVLGGSDGGFNWSEPVAQLLSTHGFVALATAYFGIRGLPSRLIDIAVENIVSAIEIVRELVDEHPVGIMGRSRGGELALQTAALCPEIRAAVVCSASSVRWVGFDPQTSDARAAWTWRGVPLPYLTLDAATLEGAHRSHPVALVGAFAAAMRDEERVHNATIPVEQIQGPILLCSGADDRMWPAQTFGDIAMRRREALAHSFPDRHVVYADAGHAVGVTPAHSGDGVVVVHPLDQRPYLIGGTAAGNAAAATDVWPRILGFLREHLAPAETDSRAMAVDTTGDG